MYMLQCTQAVTGDHRLLETEQISYIVETHFCRPGQTAITYQVNLKVYSWLSRITCNIGTGKGLAELMNSQFVSYTDYISVFPAQKSQCTVCLLAGKPLSHTSMCSRCLLDSLSVSADKNSM